jgi:hypothetical protein
MKHDKLKIFTAKCDTTVVAGDNFYTQMEGQITDNFAFDEQKIILLLHFFTYS